MWNAYIALIVLLAVGLALPGALYIAMRTKRWVFWRTLWPLFGLNMAWLIVTALVAVISEDVATVMAFATPLLMLIAVSIFRAAIEDEPKGMARKRARMGSMVDP